MREYCEEKERVNLVGDKNAGIGEELMENVTGNGIWIVRRGL